jgi:hypothetical protein
MNTQEGRDRPNTGDFVPVGEAARICMITRDGVDLAIRKGYIRVTRNAEGQRVVSLADVLDFKSRMWARF